MISYSLSHRLFQEIPDHTLFIGGKVDAMSSSSQRNVIRFNNVLGRGNNIMTSENNSEPSQ